MWCDCVVWEFVCVVESVGRGSASKRSETFAEEIWAICHNEYLLVTPEQRKEIRERMEQLEGDDISLIAGLEVCMTLVRKDIPALLDEIERLEVVNHALSKEIIMLKQTVEVLNKLK